jgi:adenylate cyclase
MNTQDFKRKLTAVFCADVAGYSRLMGEDEVATVKTLEAYKQVMFSLIKQHRGRVIDSPGDNLLAEFASVVDAVQCGVAVQKELQARNAELPENRKMQFRIGINLGDVIEEQDRIYGDGVNIAARLESCADPGGICVSKTAFDHIETKLPLGYEYLGEKEVKNIAKPVGAYRVLMEPRVTVAGVKIKAPKVPLWRHKAVLASMIVVLVVIFGVAVWNFYWRAPKIEPASKEKMAHPLPDKPSIAVLPFANMSQDPKQDFFSDGLTEDIITSLSKVPNIFVIARNSTFTYKGKHVKVQQVAEDLGVRYVLEGSIQISGDRVRITAQLIDALKGNHVWSERYDREMKDFFALQDKIALEILKALDAKLTYGEGGRIQAKGTDNLDAYLKFLQARALALHFNRENNVQARQLAEEVISLDPKYPIAYHTLAIVNAQDAMLGISKSPRESFMRAIELEQKAISLDDSCASAYASLGMLYVQIREYEKGIAAGERAIEIAPNLADAYSYFAQVLCFSGRPEEAVAVSEKAFRLNPVAPPSYYYMNGAHSYALTGRSEDGIRMAKEMLARWPNLIYGHIQLAGFYTALGRDEEARAAALDVLRIDPKFSAQRYVRMLPYKDPAINARLLERLRKAGLPD